MNETTNAKPPSAPVYGRERHAAHTGPGAGWDLDRWDYAAPATLSVPEGIPADAEYHHGYLDTEGVQHWVYYRRAPFSSGRCVFCPPIAGDRS